MKVNHAFWRKAWQAALANTPKPLMWVACRDCHKPEFYQPQGCKCDDGCIVGWYRVNRDGGYGRLGKTLGWPAYSTGLGGSYNVHSRVYVNLCRGSKPRDPKMAKHLLAIAGMTESNA